MKKSKEPKGKKIKVTVIEESEIVDGVTIIKKSHNEDAIMFWPPYNSEFIRILEK
jgi:hypothetical protein